MKNQEQRKIEQFFAAYPQKRFEKGETIIQAFQQPRGVYYIEEGQIRQFIIGDNGEQIVVNVYLAGSFIPMMWAVNGTENKYVFEAMNDVTARLASKADVLAFLHSEPGVTFDLMTRVFSGLDGMMMRMVHLMRGSASVIVLHELVVQAKRARDSPHKKGVTLELKEYELAMLCGLTRETVSRQFKVLKEQELVRLTAQRIEIPDISLLEIALNDQL